MLTYDELIKNLKRQETRAVILVLLSSKKRLANVQIIKKALEDDLIRGKMPSLRVMVSRTLAKLNELGLVKVQKTGGNNLYSIQPNARGKLMTLMAPYSDYAKFSLFHKNAIFHTWMGVTIYGVTKETEKKAGSELTMAISGLRNVTSRLESLKDKQRKEFLEKYMAKTIKRYKNLRLKRFLRKDKNILLELMETKEALFIKDAFLDDKNKYFKTFKNLNKTEQNKIKNILEKGTLQAFELYPDNLSIAVHSSNATRVSDEVHDLIYPSQTSQNPSKTTHIPKTHSK